MRLKLGLLLCLCLLGASLTGDAQESNSLPAASWYAVLWHPSSDVLRWVSVQGEAVVAPRPKLPNEAVQDSRPQVRISPNGRVMLVAAVLSNGNHGLGVYDLASGVFLRTHEAVPTEIINLGRGQIFNPAGTRAAVGFMSGDHENPAWRVILFEIGTGDALGYLDQSTPTIQRASQALPEVMFYSAQEIIHFQLVPQGVGGAGEWPSFAWQYDPNTVAETAVVQPSVYRRAGADILFGTGEMAFSYRDGNFGAMDSPVPVDNAVGRQLPPNEFPTAIWVDASSSNFSGRWAKGGEWLLYNASDGVNPAFWNIIRANGTPTANERTALSPDVVDVIGTPEGVLMVTTTRGLYHSTEFSDTEGQPIFTASESFEIIYVTPPNVAFGLQSVAVPAGFVPPFSGSGAQDPLMLQTPDVILIPTEGPTPTSNANCGLAPASRLNVGGAAIVTELPVDAFNSIGDTAAVSQIAPQTSLPILAGPLCQNGLRYWQVMVIGGDGSFQQVWVSEGTAERYALAPQTE